MTKIVINKQYGGFGLSLKAKKRYLELIGKKCYFYTRSLEKYSRVSMKSIKSIFTVTVTQDLGDSPSEIPNDAYWHDYDLNRDDPLLIQVINELGKEANGEYSDLEIIEIPDDVEWEIEEYDGWETIHEKHRSWR